MTAELTSLFAFCATLLAIILAQAMVLAKTNGMAYVMGNRDTSPTAQSALGGRLARVLGNSIEAAVIFAPFVLIAAQLGISNSMTQWSAVIFIIARIAYAVIYAAGINGLRTLVWNVGFICLVIFGLGILFG
ncbi:hypothetical protein C1J03_00970 [Sulfitobacter sp. SK012]|uniref:MAPEG family protein n=1 Tax=Sulfitobacter sp. SK012 TaxID=1389005 RepID=UPI000E0BBB83|nr:MAPEG family protein [Sulfitobacter sp. SK012]AXI44725.1 hypothetical protein C1J03_00970 [Sulfitobacter sp. SK012]